MTLSDRPMTRRELIVAELAIKCGISPFVVREAIASVALAYPPGWLDQPVEDDERGGVRCRDAASGETSP